MDVKTLAIIVVVIVTPLCAFAIWMASSFFGVIASVIEDNLTMLQNIEKKISNLEHELVKLKVSIRLLEGNNVNRYR